MIRIVLTFWVALACVSLASSQELAPSLKLSFGTTKKAVVAAFGKPFGPFAVAPGDDNAVIGAPTGRWDVYHLAVSPDRMYVTIVHFGAGSNGGSDSAKVVDALMLMPAGTTTVSQILRDQPEFAAVCKTIWPCPQNAYPLADRFKRIIHPRSRSSGGGNVEIGLIDFQGGGKGGKTVPSFFQAFHPPAFPSPASAAAFIMRQPASLCSHSSFQTPQG